MSPLPGADLFTNGSVPRLRIDLRPLDMESLRKEAREFVPATVSEGTSVYTNVAVHLKGATGSFRPLDDKPGFTLDFCRFQPGRKFHGLRRIHLNNSVEDPSYLNEKLGSELFRAAGVPAPRVTRALVTLNGRALGLYVLKEGFTEDFLSCHFKQVGGDLYEPDAGHDVDQRLKRLSVQAPFGNRAALDALAAAALEPDPARRWQSLEQTLDMDRFLTFMALEIMLCHRDGYCLVRNNFRVYHDLDSRKMLFLPHGMDQLFGKADFPWQPSMGGLVAKAVMDTPEGSQRYAERFRSLFARLFKPDTLAARADELVLELRPFLGSADYAAVRREAAKVKERIRQRHLDLKAQLDRPQLKLMEFSSDAARLENWEPVEAQAGMRLERLQVPQEPPALRIVAGAAGAASWRAKALLGRGRYRFEGRAKVLGVKPLPFGTHQGAGLRVSGGVRQANDLTGDSSWQTLTAEFKVDSRQQEIEFICELRASAGEARFNLDSLKIVKLGPD